MPGTVLSGVYLSPVTLSSASENPALVTGVISPNGGTALRGLAGTAWTVTNQGTIDSAATGIALASGGTVNNSALIVAGTKGYISNGTYASGLVGAGVYIYGAPGTMTNTGRIMVYGTSGLGVALSAGGSVTNSGTITDNFSGLNNLSLGISLGAAGNVSNLAGGFVNGIVVDAGAGTVVNQGSIGSATLGIVLRGGGFVSNASGGTIFSTSNIRSTNNRGEISFGYASGTVLNQGYVGGLKQVAVYLENGGFVSNGVTGTISAYNYAAVDFNNGGTLVNQGSIGGTGFIDSGVGVAIGTGGLIINAAGAVIGSKNNLGIAIVAHSTVMNTGTILGILQRYFDVTSSFVSNASSGLIEGVELIGTADTLVNSGTVTGATVNNGVITNAAGGAIIGYSGYRRGGGGAYVGAGTLTNAGTIAVGTIIGTGRPPTHYDAVQFGTAATNRLIDDPGAVFVGGVNGGNTIGSSFASTLELASGASQGILSGLGVQFYNFTQTMIDTGATWMLTSPSNIVRPGATLSNYGVLTLTNTTLTDAGSLQNNGTILLGPSTLVAYTIAGSGMVTMNAGTLAARGVVSSGQTIIFAGTNSFVKISNTVAFAGTMTSFAQGDTIELGNFTATGSAFSNGMLTIASAGGSATLALPGSFTTSSFVVAASGPNTDITLAPVCFCAGTRIDTPDGERAIESLRPGDRVLTLSGPAREIIWIGHRRIDLTRHARPQLAEPIRIRRGAFGTSLPRRDLLLSPNHAVFIDDVLIPVRLLVNDTSIVRAGLRGTVHYLHIELASHDVLLADGLPTESYLDAGDRAMFENAGRVTQLHPDLQSLAWEAGGYAPLVVTGPALQALRQRLAMRADACVPRRQIGRRRVAH